MHDQQDILWLHEQWISVEKSGHSLEVLEFCRDDVVWLIPAVGAVCGKPAVRSWLEQQPEVAIEQIEFSKIEVEVSGSLAVKRADFRTTLKPPENSDMFEILGTHLWTLYKDEILGFWQVTNVCWSIKG